MVVIGVLLAETLLYVVLRVGWGAQKERSMSDTGKHTLLVHPYSED